MKYPILLPNIFNHPFTYKSYLPLKIGDYVNVPFGKKTITGIVWNEFENDKNKKFNLKSVKEKLNVEPLRKEMVEFLSWFSEYNLVPLGMVLKSHLLSGKAIEKKNSSEFSDFRKKFEIKNFKLSPDQEKVFDEIVKKDDRFRVHLLQGTTGSGKTLIYFRALEKILRKNLQSLILLPEIGLTGEFENKFKDFFGFEAAIWHSKISPKKKKLIWSGLSNGDIKVVIGARSALFLPFKKLGIIIVDEEHDQSYKQNEGINYNARDMAISRANHENIPINLVTAVPSIETYFNVIKKKYFISQLTNRYLDANLPSYEIIDLNQNKLQKKNIIAQTTIEKVLDHLNRNDQILFFVNRRGFAPYVLCKKCLNLFSCPNCSINLVFHKISKKLLCHYCGYHSDFFRNCKKEGECDFVFSGPGVEKIAEEVKKIFPNKRTEIFSSDTINKSSGKKILKKIINNEIDIIVGTQLISKGFHFPNLNCIVVLDIDLASQSYDLRSSEKNLQLYHQLIGRAGRTGKPAKVYFQTFTTDVRVINQITNKDPFIFLGKELLIRRKNFLPPYERFISLILSSKFESDLQKNAYELKNLLSKNLSEKVLGPVTAPIYRIKNQYRQRILIRAKKSTKIQKKLLKLLKKHILGPRIKLSVDVDPINFN